MAKTYIPTLVAILRRLDRYSDRWNETLLRNMTPQQVTAYDAMKTAVTALITALTTIG